MTTQTDKAIARALQLSALYLAVTLFPLVASAIRTNDIVLAGAHLAALVVVGVVLFLRGQASRGAIQVIRDWLPTALVLPLYLELHALIVAVGQPRSDALVQKWERALFPSDPSSTWMELFPSPMASELLHACYLSYYALVLVPLALLYVRGQREGFAATQLALTLVFLLCFSIYVVFPVDGPRYLVNTAPAVSGPIRNTVLWLLETASSRGTAFPSSHVAAAVVASVFALRYQRRLGWIIATSTAGLALGAIYGGFHYAVDIVAGAVMGAAVAAMAVLAWRTL